jgi:hypothetical protein
MRLAANINCWSKCSNRKVSARCDWPSSSSKRNSLLKDSSRRSASARCLVSPRRIGIVTSPRGAAIADMVEILSRRFPGIHIRIFPAQVQGEGSVEDVCRAIQWFSRSGWPDLIIVGRGGGSLEDLWTFNEEAVARAIAACSVPVVSAVGHETDVTIADFVADLRAPTPSAAAEMAICTREELLDRLAGCRSKAVQAMRYRLAMLERRLRNQGVDRALGVLHRRVGRGLQRVDEQEFRLRERVRLAIESRQRARRALDERLRRFDVRPRLAAAARRLQAADTRAAQTMRLCISRHRSRLEQLSAKLSQLSPLAHSGARVRHRVQPVGHPQGPGGGAPRLADSRAPRAWRSSTRKWSSDSIRGMQRIYPSGLGAVTLGLGAGSPRLAAAQTQPSKTLDMYVVDTEGGHAVLYVSPSGESLLEDTGNPGRARPRPHHGGHPRRGRQADRPPDSHPLPRRPRGRP